MYKIEDLNTKKVADLKEIAIELKLQKIEKLKKTELVYAILDKQAESTIINKKDKKITQDLIVAAVNKALKDVDFKSKEHIKSKTKDIIPDIPGFDIGNIFK